MKIMSNYGSEVTRLNISDMLQRVKENKGKGYKGSITARDLKRMNKEQ